MGTTEPDLLASYPPQRPRPEVWGGWATLGLSVAIVIGQAVVQAFVGFGLAVSSGGSRMALGLGAFVSLALIVSAPVAIGMTFLFIKARDGLSFSAYVDLRPPTIGQIVRWTLALVAAVVAFVFLASTFTDPQTQQFIEDLAADPHPIPLVVFAIVIVAPITEELIFRGFMFTGLERSAVGGTGAVVITSVLWSLLHAQYDLLGMSQILVIGIIFGLARLKTRSLWVCIVLHALFNLFGVVALLVGL